MRLTAWLSATCDKIRGYLHDFLQVGSVQGAIAGNRNVGKRHSMLVDFMGGLEQVVGSSMEKLLELEMVVSK